MKTALAFLILAVTLLVAALGQPIAAAILLFIAGNAISRPTARLCVTLSAAEVLLKVMEAFAKRLPGLAYMGTDFQANSLKLGNTYTAHIAGVATTESITNANYGNMTGQNARDLLTDIPVTASNHIGTKLKLQHLYAIKDNKFEYDKVMAAAGYSLAKTVIDDIIGDITTENFSQQSNFSVANSDCDMLDSVCGSMNTVGAASEGRCMLVNTSVAGILAADSRLTSADYAGQRVRGSGYRRWTDVNGFAEIMEYPDLANTTSGTALTAVTCANTGDVFTKASHGLATGMTVTAASFSAGFSSGTYYVIRTGADTFQLASSYANAIAGTAAAVSADGTGGVITPTQTLTGFAWEPRALAILGGVPQDFNMPGLNLNVNRVMSMETVTHPDLKMTMAVVTWQEAGTGDIYWIPTLVYGFALGRQGATNGLGGKADYAGHRLVSA